MSDCLFRYGSTSRFPLTKITPLRSSTTSPGSPMTRLMKSSQVGADTPSPSVIQWKNEDTGLRCGSGHWPGLENTMMSPRDGPWNL